MLFDKFSCQFYKNIIDIKFVIYSKQSDNIDYVTKKYKKKLEYLREKLKKKLKNINNSKQLYRI